MIQVMYDGIVVGDFVADLWVDGRVLVEVKAVREFNDAHLAWKQGNRGQTRMALP